MIEEFNLTYENKIWGDDLSFNKYYSGSSGGGSEIDYNSHDYIPFLQTFIEKNNINIHTVCHLGCESDEMIVKICDILNNNCKYYGYDCYSKVILYIIN